MKFNSTLAAILTLTAGRLCAADFADVQTYGARDVAALTASVRTPPSPAPQKAGTIQVESRISELPVYNAQTEALTISKVCKLLEGREADLGKTTSVRCIDRQNGVLELAASDSRSGKTRSILANASDKTVVEYRGFDYVHYYRNNLGQDLTLNFIFVTAGTSQVSGGTLIHGNYRADFYLRDKAGQNRFGYFSNLNN